MCSIRYLCTPEKRPLQSIFLEYHLCKMFSIWSVLTSNDGEPKKKKLISCTQYTHIPNMISLHASFWRYFVYKVDLQNIYTHTSHTHTHFFIGTPGKSRQKVTGIPLFRVAGLMEERSGSGSSLRDLRQRWNFRATTLI